MQDEQLGRIEAKLDRVIGTQKEHSESLAQHTATLAQHTETLAQHTETLAQHTETLAQHTTILSDHSQRLERLDTRTSAIELTLENTVPQAIMQIAEGHAMLRQQMDRGFAEIKRHIDARLGPLEETVRQHSVKLNQLT